jgi:amino acid adenylation domain-containing protein
MVLLSVFNILLSRLSNQEDIIVGTPVAGRRHADLEPIIGMFVNTLALRSHPIGEKTFRQFLSEVKTQTLEAFENQDYQFEELVEQVEVKRDAGRNPLFDVMFLDEKSHRLALLLIEKGIRPDTIAAIMLEQSIEMTIGIIGILKAGGAYLPIAPEYPEKRIEYMLADSKAKVLLSAPDLVLAPGPPASTLTSTLTCRVSSTNLAYIIYTSGTTGNPKGVEVEHKGVVNTLWNRKQSYGMKPGFVSLQLFSYVFDGFVTSFFTPLISGSKVILMRHEDSRDIEAIGKAITKNQVTHFISIPALYGALLEALTAADLCSLKSVTLAGDRVGLYLLERTLAKTNGVEIVNEYGVTEGSVMSTINHHQERDSRITIGHPAWNTWIYILDETRHLQPIGVSGELCIGGEGLARGYLNNPELTAERFNQDLWDYQDYHDRSHRSHKSYKSYSSKKLYKTGDLARWLPDGNIEFSGRIDHQVKSGDFVIEPGEIENHLLNSSTGISKKRRGNWQEKMKNSVINIYAPISFPNRRTAEQKTLRDLPGKGSPRVCDPLIIS